jgi:hypothetical protein
MDTPNPTPAKQEQETPRTAQALERIWDRIESARDISEEDNYSVAIGEVAHFAGGLEKELSALRSSNGQLEGRVARLELALEAIASQTLSHELAEEDKEEADFDLAYDTCIETARQALHHPKTDAGEHQS